MKHKMIMYHRKEKTAVVIVEVFRSYWLYFGVTYEITDNKTSAHLSTTFTFSCRSLHFALGQQIRIIDFSCSCSSPIALARSFNDCEKETLTNNSNMRKTIGLFYRSITLLKPTIIY